MSEVENCEVISNREEEPHVRSKQKEKLQETLNTA